jgi:large subunit ribosomal protein L9
MQVILLERIGSLGQIGDVVKVKDGFARNYLLPQGKALRANEANLARFEAERTQIEARNAERKQEAEAIDKKLGGTSYVVIRSAGETGQLYGSVSTRDIANALAEEGFTVARNQVNLTAPIKMIGLHEVEIVLHPEVSSVVNVNVARSEDEAERQAAGEDLTTRDAFEIDEEEDVDLAEVFETEEGDEEAAEGDDEQG